jgi:uncharacterized membrane protein
MESRWTFDEATRRGRVCGFSLTVVLISVWRVSSHHADPNPAYPAFIDWAIIALVAPAAVYHAVLELRCRVQDSNSGRARRPLAPFVLGGVAALAAATMILGLALWVLGITPWAFVGACMTLAAAILGLRASRARERQRLTNREPDDR